MAHHGHDRYFTGSSAPTLSLSLQPSENIHILDEEVIPDADEPPDNTITFHRQPIRSPTSSIPLNSTSCIRKPCHESLLTQGLLVATENRPLTRSAAPLRQKPAISSYSNESLASTAELTSDAGLTSPARSSTPSPPLPHISLPTLDVNGKQTSLIATTTQPAAAKGDEPQTRKRCITFACSRPQQDLKPAEQARRTTEMKRPSAIKFACVSKPKDENQESRDRFNRVGRSPRPSKKRGATSGLISSLPHSKDQIPKKDIEARESFQRSPTLSKKSRHSEALRFHEFASKHIEDDEWIHEKPRRQSRLTINDTLRKENEIRRIGEEAEAEALEEEEYDEFVARDDAAENDDQEDSENDDDSDCVYDDGNETDDEEGFAASDNESEQDPDYQFWTPAVATAAISAEQLDEMRLKRRSISQSSIESLSHDNDRVAVTILSQSRTKRASHKSKTKMRPGTPELPDSTDFVCGTLDEDRPLEAAYLSCLEQRKKAKQCVIPQDVDPSFPTSDPEQDQSDDNNDGVEADENIFVAADHFEETGDARQRGRWRRKSRSPTISPKRVKSPVARRAKSPAPVISRTPLPRRLFGPSARYLRSSLPSNPVSPPSSRRPSYGEKIIVIPRLAQRPHLTHTKSLPRTPNPFWQQHRNACGVAFGTQYEADEKVCDRGPIDIVQGLERRRQRRKEKFWLIHCRKDAKEKDRRRQPGKGAQRMREVGLEMADRCKGYGHRVPLVLSV